MKKKTTIQKKFVVVKAELDGIDIEETGNLKDLPRLAFIDEDCGNLKVVADGGELTRNINKKPMVKKNTWMRKTFGAVMVNFVKVPF